MSASSLEHAASYGSLPGRFLSPDKLQGKIPSPQTWNRYSYALNNPLKYVDADGQSALTFVVGALAQFGSNLTLGAVQVESDDPDFQEGQRAGDVASVAAASVEFEAGKAAIVGGLATAPESAGSSLVASGAGALAVLHAPALAIVAANHLMASGRPDTGGGRTDRKISRDNLERGADRIAKLRGELQELKAKPNKTRPDKEAIARKQRELNRAIDQRRASEEHARTTQRK